MISALLGLLLLLPAPVQPIEDDNALLGALKRVILSSSPAGLLKNLTRITFYRSVPPRTRVLEFTAGPLDADELDQKERMQQQQHSPIFSSFPTSKQAGPALSSPCVQPQQVGNGPYRIPRWFFNPGHAKCELFYWSGCCGNANNFGSREVCQRTCEVGTSSSNLNSPTAAAGPNTLIYLPVSMTFASSAPSAASSSPLRPAESAVATSEVSATGDRLLRPPQFPVSNSRQINDNASNGGGPADWVSLEAEEQLDRVATSRSSNQHQRQVQPAAAVSSSGAATNGVVSNWRFSSLETPVANPCAFGTSGQFVLCQPAAASACGGQQFCHVGESPVTTVCCNKPAAIDVCHQPVSPGVGQSALQRWYFYSPAGQCQTFNYRGLQGNENNFQSRMDCEQLCQANPCALGNPMRDFRGQIGYCSAQQPNICPAGFYCHVGGDPRTSLCCPSMAGDPCAQPMNPGQGFYQLQRFFWDAAARCCRPFVYRGQKGNQNNFLSADDCNRVCYVPPNPCRLPIEQPLQPCQPGPEACDGRSDLYCHIGAGPETTVCCPAEPDRCQQPIEPGDGDAQLPRFGYDPQSQQCRQFAYGGLKGNPNNFQTQEECEQACLPNPCASGTPFVGADGRIQGCAVSTSMSTCPNGHWCHVGVNSATTVCCPDANPNPCQLPMSTGEGFARLERFYYDPASKSCKSFTYKGLKGNQNNFLTLRACQLACLPLDNPCIGQPAKTPSGQVLFCSATNRDTCPVNFWCHLGAIPETTVCCPGATNPCSVPLAPGTGNAGLARWYYNADERQCVSFQYNGKRGNQNNFLSQDECQIACPSLLCLLSIDRGSCSGRQTRYAFSREKGECVPFEYTGCGGNLNNFLSLQECQQICGNVRF